MNDFSYAQMELLCQELKKRIIGFKVVDCIPNDRQRFFLVLRQQNQQQILFFCFTAPFVRFHLIHFSPLPRTHSSHPLLAFLKDAILENVELLHQDRILQLAFHTSSGKRLLVAECFSKHPNYYLLQPDGTILFALHSLNRSHYHPPTKSPLTSPKIPRWSSHQEVEQAYAKQEQEWEFTREKQILQAHLNQHIKRLQRKEQALLHALKQCTQWSKIQHEGELIKAHFALIKKGMSSLSVWDWLTDQPYLLELDPTKSPQEEMAARFRKAKKLQRGEEPLTLQLKQTQTMLDRLHQQQQKLHLLKTHEELALFKSETKVKMPYSSLQPIQKATNVAPSLIYREYQSAKGLKIWVGKNAKANDQLTFQLANGRDWWLHTRGYSGSHVVIRLAKDQQPDEETLKDAFQLALHYSKAKAQGEAEICLTQRKYVSRSKGNKQAGQVQISKHQIIWVRDDPSRFQALKDRLTSRDLM